MSKLLLRTVCPRCNKDLTRDEWVTLNFRLPDGRHGKISLSAYFCTYSIKVPFPIPKGTVTTLSCPHCRADLTSEKECGLCAAPLFTIGIKTGGIIDVCSRKGCRGHALGGFAGPDELMVLINNMVDQPFL
jgi:hypothetical protein